jgi:hypothetical protein
MTSSPRTSGERGALRTNSTQTVTNFANQLEDVLEFVDPTFTRLDLGPERIPLVIVRPYNRAVDNVEGSALNGQIEAVFGIASPHRVSEQLNTRILLCDAYSESFPRRAGAKSHRRT